MLNCGEEEEVTEGRCLSGSVRPLRWENSRSSGKVQANLHACTRLSFQPQAPPNESSFGRCSCGGRDWSEARLACSTALLEPCPQFTSPTSSLAGRGWCGRNRLRSPCFVEGSRVRSKVRRKIDEQTAPLASDSANPTWEQGSVRSKQGSRIHRQP